MEKKLPKMYKNKIDKKFQNTQEVFSSLERNKIIHNEPKKDNINNRYMVEQKIYNIFNSPDFIYKADVNIVTEEGILKKRIIGKTKDKLITMDNEKISIDSIKDIYK